jgi:hypothetical protein
MVFLGNYAYQHYWSLMGPVGKVALMYLGSAGLIAAGIILPRRQERLKNYGQVLYAGGLAAIYFTTYAAHHFPNLRIIESAVLDGFLLLAWTAFIVWLADRKKSEVTALFAIGLAYYTALITNVGSFTLISNLLLAAAAVFFLIRNRWVTLTFLSVAASYGSYFYWRYYAGSATETDFAGSFSIIGYWIIFTAAVFLTRHVEFAGPRRAGFLTFNNAAAFTLLTVSIYYQRSGNFWQLSLIGGSILLALSIAALKLIADDALPRRAYLAQGLFLITLGLITKLSGPTLALVLAVESALLVVFSTQWKSQLLGAAARIVAAVSALWLLFNLSPNEAGAGIKAAGVCALLLFNAFWLGKHDPPLADPIAVRPVPTYFAAWALVSWCAATFILAAPQHIAPILSTIAVALTALHYVLRVREVTSIAQVSLAVAQLQMFLRLVSNEATPAWSPILVVLISLTAAVWWRHQKSFLIEAPFQRFLEILCAAAAAGIAQVYLSDAIRPSALFTTSWILTFAFTALAFFTRSWPIAATGQIFVLTAAVNCAYFMLLRGDHDRAHHSVELIAATLILDAIAFIFSKRRPELTALRAIPHVYQWLAVILCWSWTRAHLDQQFFALTILFAASTIAGWRGARYAFAPGVFLAAVGLITWITTDRVDAVALQNLLGILIIAASQIFARKSSERFQLPEAAHHTWIAFSSAALWLYVSWWVIAHSAGAHFYLTASWAILAFGLFGIGFALRERTYRWAALTILACALARVVILDVWTLQTVYRIFSFLALGFVLLALGYVYTRFQEKIAKWL